MKQVYLIHYTAIHKHIDLSKSAYMHDNTTNHHHDYVDECQWISELTNSLLKQTKFLPCVHPWIHEVTTSNVDLN